MVKTILGKVKGFLHEGFLETNLFHVGLAWRYHRFRSSFPKLFFKITVPQNSVNSQENSCVGISPLINLQVGGLQLYRKIDADT